MKKFILLASLFFMPFTSHAMATLRISTSAQPQPDKYYDYNFGAVFVNQRVWADFTLTAGGDEPTELEAIQIRGFEYSASTNCPKILQPGQSCVTRVYFWPTRKGAFWGELNFYAKAHNIYIRLFGQTFR